MPPTMEGSFQNLLPQSESPYYPQSPMSPVFRQQDRPQMLARHQSLGDDSIPGGMTPRNNNFVASSPVINSKHFSPVPLSAPISLDGRSSQFSSGNNTQQDPLASFLPPPPNLDASFDASQQIGRLDNNNTGLFLSENENQQPKSPFVSTPRSQGNLLNDTGFSRERSLSSPGPSTYLRQPSFGAKSPLPASSNQILYEDKPSSWNEGPGFPPPSMYSEGPSSSPTNYDRFSSRPPRHSGSKDAQAILSPRIEMRHAASDGNFNIPAPLPLAGPGHMSPNHNQGSFQPQIGGPVIGSPSFDSSLQGGQGSQMNLRHSLGSMDEL